MISYDKPKDIRELESLNVLDEKLKNRKIIVEEKIDGYLSDNISDACIEIDKDKILCLYGENLDVKNFHLLRYFLPSKIIVFDCAIVESDRKIYLDPKICAKLTFNIGGVFVPIVYYGTYSNIYELMKFLGKPSLLPNEINSKLFEILKEEEREMLRDREKKFREGVVIKTYEYIESSINLLSYKIVDEIFEKLLKKYPRDEYKHLYLPNVIKPFDYHNFKEYWEGKVFNKLGLEVNEREFLKAYENYLNCYNKNSIRECIESSEENINYVTNFVNLLLRKLYI